MDDRKELLRRFLEYCLAEDSSYFSFCAIAQDMSASEAADLAIEEFLTRESDGDWSRTIACTGHGNGNGGCGSRWRYRRDDVIDTNPGGLFRRKTYGVTCPHCGIVTDIDHDQWPADLRRKFDQTMKEIYG